MYQIMTEKKPVPARIRFRELVHARDGYKCKKCGNAPPVLAYQILDRYAMPNGGFVLENGISLCDPCVAKAVNNLPGFTPEDLFSITGSSRERAIEADLEPLR